MTTAAQELAARMLWQMSSWAAEGACLTTDAQMAGNWESDTYSDTEADALAVYCMACLVGGPCLELALVLEVRTGIRGGLTPAERIGYVGATHALSLRPELRTDQP